MGRQPTGATRATTHVFWGLVGRGVGGFQGRGVLGKNPQYRAECSALRRCSSGTVYSIRHQPHLGFRHRDPVFSIAWNKSEDDKRSTNVSARRKKPMVVRKTLKLNSLTGQAKGVKLASRERREPAHESLVRL